MEQRNHLSWWRYGWLAIGLSSLVLLTLYLLILHSAAQVQAQGNDLGMEITKRVEGNTTVQLGEIIDFTIRVVNTGTLPITRLVVVDVFEPDIVDPARVGAFAEPDDPPLSDPPGDFDGTDTIVWDDLLDDLPGGVLAAGEEIIIRVRLRAVHPTDELQLVNRARIQEAIRSNGEDASGDEAEAEAEAPRGNAPVDKSLGVPLPVTVGDLITFTITLRNEGTVPLETAPLTDNYNPSVLEFVRASPPPSSANEATGQLEWNDLLALTGRDSLPPGEAIEVTTIYRALQPVDSAVNRASVSGATDRYGNDLAESEAEAPIRIIDAPTRDTATPTRGAATATATTAAQVTATTTGTAPTATASSTPYPAPSPRPTSTAEPGPTTSTATATAPTSGTARATRTSTAATETEVVPTETRRPRRDDDDDDDDDDTPRATATQAAMTPTSGGTTPTSVGAFTPTLTATLTATVTSQPATTTATLAATRTATPGTPVPASLPITGAPSSDATGWLILLVAALLLLLGAALHSFRTRRSRQPAPGADDRV